MSKSLSLRLAAALGLIAACSSNSGPSTNLKPVFFRTVTAAPVATITLQRQNGTPMNKAQVRFDTHALFDGWLNVGRSVTATANASGVAAIALTAGTYPMRIDSNVGSTVGRLNSTLVISADVNQTFQTSQQNWTVTSPVPVSALHVVVYQVDADGKALYGGPPSPTDPVVLSTNVSGGNSNSVSFATELFKGSYRAVINAVPTNSTDNIAPYESAPFQTAGAGATEPQAVTLITGGNVVSLQLQDNGGAPVPDGDIGGVSVFDAGSLIYLASGNYASGAATVGTGSVANVIAVVESPDGSTLSAAQYTAAATATPVTLTRYTVSGHVKAPGGASLAQANNGYGTVTAALQPGLGTYWDSQVSDVPATVSDALGTYQLKLFAGSYQLQAVELKNLPPSAPVAASVSADVPAQDIPVDAGGVITGNVQDQAHNNVQGVSVFVVDSTHETVGHATTDLTGNYSIAVRYGTYEVFADGALTRDISVSSGAATTTLNLTRFQITGRLIDAAQGPVAGKIYWGGGNVTATSLGTYTLNAIQGVNWFLFTPPATSPSLGFTYEPDVLINADTVKTLQ